MSSAVLPRAAGRCWRSRCAATGAAAAIVLGTAIAAPAPSLARPAPAVRADYVRVNQVGYPTGTPKRAYLLAATSQAGGHFQVRTTSGRLAFTGDVGADLGSWSATFPFVYALDFDRLNAPGAYVVTGPDGSRSPPFRIGSAQRLYAAALHNALTFYQNERDGPDYIPSALRTAPGHLNDAHALTYLPPKTNGNGNFRGDLTSLGSYRDVAGGWWDAGDYLKFVETTSYVVDMMLLGIRNFPHQMGAAAPAGQRFTAEARFGLDFLREMWDEQTKTLYYQVGIGAGNKHTVSDHDIWRLPQVDDTYGGDNPLFRYIRHRPVFRAGPPGSPISPNLAGRLAAAFALCYQVDRRTDPRYADGCLKDAEDVFALAGTHWKGRLLTAVPYGFYPETEWRDDLELGATELYDALAAGRPPAGLRETDPRFYLRAAAHWANAYMHTKNDAMDTLNLYDVSGIAHYELYRAIGRAGHPKGLEVTQAGLLADMAKALGRAIGIGSTDPFGFGFPWAHWDTTTHGFGLVVMADELDQLTHSRTYATYAWRWLANVLGANAWGVSLVVGDGDSFPDCMQHQVANLVGSRDGRPPILAGAVVEGPNSFAATGVVKHMRPCPVGGGDRYASFDSTAVFQDNVQSYSTVEPAIDLTVASPVAFAWVLSGT